MISKHYKGAVGNVDSVSNNEEVDEEAMLDELYTLNIAGATLIILIIAVMLNMYYIYYSKVGILDILNNTNNQNNLIDGSRIPRLSNNLFIVITSIFLALNLRTYIQNVNSEEPNESEINRSNLSVTSSLLIVIATLLTSQNLEV